MKNYLALGSSAASLMLVQSKEHNKESTGKAINLVKHEVVLDPRAVLAANDSGLALDIDKTQKPWLCKVEFKLKSG